MLARVTIEPRSPSTLGCSIIAASAALATRNVPVRLIAMTRSHSVLSSRWTGPPPATPAEWTTPSTRPGIVANTSVTAASSVISAATNSNCGPRSSVGAVRSVPTTMPPSANSRRAVARPMPDAAPVTTNVREADLSALTMARPYALRGTSDRIGVGHVHTRRQVALTYRGERPRDRLTRRCRLDELAG